MNKKRLSIILTIFFLVQGISASHILSAETLLLNPPTRVSLNDSQFSIEKPYSTICVALLIYKLDVEKRYSKERIKEEYGDFIHRFSETQFDLEHMDIGKKGWTRYYPFSVNGQSFIIRFFLTSETALRSAEVPIGKALYQDTVRHGKITFQILPGINELLKDCNIKPNRISLESPVNSSS